ncbi:hypothetical protein [Streptomyces sp. NBC_01237]|uniref:hypothetical protein n=1 Tax=Streptomyces sp. NBC_01237 TaxID=2903790 RepID=UPI002DD929E9|nr:hypothetical protein [Streptomyces sp. NBC_01237]WRZ77281.1 hypothetical protein OG251_37130 [Streptomyces sp. NBC_01237]
MTSPDVLLAEPETTPTTHPGAMAMGAQLAAMRMLYGLRLDAVAKQAALTFCRRQHGRYCRVQVAPRGGGCRLPWARDRIHHA